MGAAGLLTIESIPAHQFRKLELVGNSAGLLERLVEILSRTGNTHVLPVLDEDRGGDSTTSSMRPSSGSTGTTPIGYLPPIDHEMNYYREKQVSPQRARLN